MPNINVSWADLRIEPKVFSCAREEISVRYNRLEEEIKRIILEKDRVTLAHKLNLDIDTSVPEPEPEELKTEESSSVGQDGKQYVEDLVSHPFFLRGSLEKRPVAAPLVERPLWLNPCPEKKSPRAIAIASNCSGNFNFQFKNYKMALEFYNKGLEQEFDDQALKAQLYNNRAAAHFSLRNYSAAYSDCKTALEISPDYLNAQKRMALITRQLLLFDECIEMCDKIIPHTDDPEFYTLKDDISVQKIKYKIKQMQEEYARLRENSNERVLYRMVHERQIKFHPKGFWDMSEVVLPYKVENDNGKLIWPVVLLYPEHNASGIIERFPEDDTFETQLNKMFKNFAQWDINRKYYPGSWVVHYEDLDGKIHSVDGSSTLQSVISEEHFRVNGHSPVFIVHAKETEAYKSFLQQHEE